MVIFLYGPDTYRLNAKLDGVIEAYRQKKQGINFKVFDAIDCDADEFLRELRQDSLFREKKLFVAKGIIANKEFKESIIENAGVLFASAHNIVLCQEGKVLKADRLLGAMVKKGAQIQAFELLGGAKLVAWAIHEFKALNRQIEPQALEMLIDRTGSDLWRLANEIQKLCHRRKSGTISVRDVEETVRPAIETNIFKTIDALAQRDKKAAIGLLHEHIQDGDHPIYLLAMVASQFRNLLLVKESLSESGGYAAGQNMAARLGIHPYVFGKTVQQSGRFTLSELKSIFNKIAKADRQIKTGTIDPLAGLDILVAGL